MCDVISVPERLRYDATMVPVKPDALLNIASTPSGLLLVIGLGLFGWGAYKGPFSMRNAMITWGVAALSVSFAWHYLGNCRNALFDGQRTRYFWHQANLILGIVFLLVGAFLTWKAVIGWL